MNTKVLFLHGFNGNPSGAKWSALNGTIDFHAHPPIFIPYPKSVFEFVNLRRNLERCLAIAQEKCDRFKPDVIVGSSLGGSLACQLTGNHGLVLIAPAITWSFYGLLPIRLFKEPELPGKTVVIHSESDRLVPIHESERLLEGRNSHQSTIKAISNKLLHLGYNQRTACLVRIGKNHRCNSPAPDDRLNRNPCPLAAMVESVRVIMDVADS